MSLLPRSSDLHDLSANHPARRDQLRQRNRFTWNLKKPEQGPAALALKNREFSRIETAICSGGDFLILRNRLYCHGWRVRRHGALHDLCSRWHKVCPAIELCCQTGITPCYQISVANIPTTSVTGSTTAGQSGSVASTANTSNLYASFFLSRALPITFSQTLYRLILWFLACRQCLDLFPRLWWALQPGGLSRHGSSRRPYTSSRPSLNLQSNSRWHHREPS